MAGFSLGRWWNKRTVYALLLCAFLLTPAMGAFEDDRTMRLAKTLYAMAALETYDTQLMLGAVVMNRVRDGRFADTVRGVLDGGDGFVRGGWYDARSMSAAREVLMGRRLLPEGYVYFVELDGVAKMELPEGRVRSGRYEFRTE